MALILAFCTAFILTVVCTPLVTQFARARGLYAHPSADRWHRRPVPKVGGIAMMLPLLLVSVASGVGQPMMPVLAASTLMFIVGLVDDFHQFRAGTKFVLQMLVAAALLFALPDVHITGNALADRLLGFAWIVGITNAVNLLDNMDGLAAGVALLAGVCFVLVLLVDGAPVTHPMIVAMAAFVGVTAGFLLFNFQPASIFMGDAGSHLLGCFLAASALMATPTLSTHVVPVGAIPVMLLLIPIFDTAFVTVARGMSGRSAFLGGRDHTSHRLAALGIGERRAVLVIYVLTALGGGAAVGLIVLPASLAWGMVALYVGMLGLVGVYLGRVRVHGGHVEPLDVPLPTEVTTRYRLYEVALDTLLVAGAYYLAFIGRFRDDAFEQFAPYFTRSVPLVVGTQIAVLWLAGKYRKVWGDLSARELIGLARVSLLGVATSVIAVLYVSRFEGYSRWVFAFDAILAPLFIVGARVGIGMLDEYLRLRRSRGRRALIYGAGRGGGVAVRELLQNPAIGLTPIGFIDDDVRKRRLKIEGLPVVAGLDDLGDYLDRQAGRIATIIVSIGDISPERLDRACEVASVRGVAVRRLRLDLEDVRRQRHPAGVVRFPGA